MTQGSLNGLNSGKELAKLKGVLRDNPGEGLKTIVVMDTGLEGRTNLVAGANKQDYHYRNVTPGRDFTPTLIADIRNINEGELDPIGGQPLRLGKAVEIGHIFKLGYKYTESMGARVLDANGKEVMPIMGCYGIGIERILTAAIESSAAKFAAEATPEQYALPSSIAPFEVIVTITNVREPSSSRPAKIWPPNWTSAGIDVLLDDRDERAGVKFKDAELIGVPYRINIGKKLAEGQVELVDRLTRTTKDLADRFRHRAPCIAPCCVQAIGSFNSISMPVKVKLASNDSSPPLEAGARRLSLVLVFVLIGAGIFGYFYFQYRGLVDERLAKGPLFASGRPDLCRSPGSPAGAGLSASPSPHLCGAPATTSILSSAAIELRGDSILIKPGPQSYLAIDGATITTTGGEVQSITAENGAALAAYKLEPQLITALSEDKNRTKRRLVTYNQIPPSMVQAVLAIEDRRFFEHGGINYVRTAKCAVQDLSAHRMNCGGSTLTQQLARGFFLSPEKTYSRKLAEIMITFQLEARFNKQQIFEMYANEINLGQRGILRDQRLRRSRPGLLRQRLASARPCQNAHYSPA